MTVDNQPKPAGSSPSTRNSRLVIAGMLLLAVAAGFAAIWYLRGLSQQSMEFWGTAGELILRAPRVEVSRRSPVDDEPIDISEARGLINVRRGLMNDASYDWNDPSVPSAGNWQYALRFVDGNREATLLLSIDPPLAMQSGADRCVSIRPIAEGLNVFLGEQFDR